MLNRHRLQVSEGRGQVGGLHILCAGEKGSATRSNRQQCACRRNVSSGIPVEVKLGARRQGLDWRRTRRGGTTDPHTQPPRELSEAAKPGTHHPRQLQLDIPSSSQHRYPQRRRPTLPAGQLRLPQRCLRLVKSPFNSPRSPVCRGPQR